MSDATPSGDVSQRGPADYLDPLAPLSAQFQQLESLLAFVFDDHEAFIQNIIEDVLELPPEERFTRSYEVIQEHLEDQYGSTDAFAAVLPESDPAKFPAVLEDLFEKLLTEILRGVFMQRDPEEHLIMAALFQLLSVSNKRLATADDESTKHRAASTMLALLSGAQHRLGASTDGLPDGLVRDIAYGLYYVAEDDGAVAFADPAELSVAEARQEVREFGAVVAYTRLDISLSRGAELVGSSPDAFREMLHRFDVEARLGPTSVEELDDATDE